MERTEMAVALGLMFCVTLLLTSLIYNSHSKSSKAIGAGLEECQITLSTQSDTMWVKNCSDHLIHLGKIQ